MDPETDFFTPSTGRAQITPSQEDWIMTVLSRRNALAAAGAVLLGGKTAAARTDYDQIWNEWGPLTGYHLSTECNPGGQTGFPCNQNDAALGSTASCSDVTANPNGNVTFVNAIANIHFDETTPDGEPIQLATYRYIYAIRLPRIPATSSAPWIGEQVHQMIQFWDGSNTLWRNANKHTLEASLNWKLNPWDPAYGKIFVYATDSGGGLVSIDTGITLTPDTNWHVFDVRADLLNRVYAGIAVDNHWNPLVNLPLAQIHQPTWGSELALILTAESENAYPGTANPVITQWTTQFRDPKLFRST